MVRQPFPPGPKPGKSWVARRFLNRSKMFWVSWGVRLPMWGRGVARGAGAFFFPEDDGEFIAADSGDEVVIANAAAHEIGELLEDFVAAAVAVLVVVLFEIVDVEEEEGHRESFEAGLFDDLGQELTEVAAVGEAGEFVGDGEALQAGVAVVQGAEPGQVAREVGEESRCCCAIFGLLGSKNGSFWGTGRIRDR